MKFGFEINDPQEILMWRMYQAYQKGISPYEFRKCNMDDLNDIFDIQSANNEKSKRDNEVRKAMEGM